MELKDLPGPHLAAFLKLIEEFDLAEAANEALQSWGFPLELADLADRYAAHTDSSYDATVASWLLARVGEGDPTRFEVAVGEIVGPGYVLPIWVLARPVAVTGVVRLPAQPIVCPIDDAILMAYQGLLDHLLLYEHDTAAELQRSAIAWRVGAVADAMEPSEDADDTRGLAQRIERIVRRIRASNSLTPDDQTVFRAWRIHRFVDVRNVLTHLTARGDITFDVACDYYERRDTILNECAAISLAVLRQASEEMREVNPPSGVIRRAAAAVDWIVP